MREIISINIGEGGINLGMSTWELFCIEHKIQANGELNILNIENEDRELGTFFSLSPHKDKYTPRAIFVDTDKSPIEQIKCGSHRELFNEDHLILTSDSYTYKTLECIRREVENCSGVQGFIIYTGLGGSTGHEVLTPLLERLSVEYGKKCKLGICIYPSSARMLLSTSMVESYNTLLGTAALIEHTDVSSIYDNQAIAYICQNSLGYHPCDVTYSCMNPLIAQMVSSMTLSLRFGGALNVDITEFQTNLVPFPDAHFLISSFAPFTPAIHNYIETRSSAELTNMVLNPQSFSVKMDAPESYIAGTLMFRGSFASKDIGPSIRAVQSNIYTQFLTWVSHTMKYGINYLPMSVLPGGNLWRESNSLLMLSNQTSIRHFFATFAATFDAMYAKRAFIHSYLQMGVEEDQFLLARDNLEGLQKAYAEMLLEDIDQ